MAAGNNKVEDLEKSIQRLPKEEQKQIFQQVNNLQLNDFSQPLPDPEVLKKFDEVVPGSAKQILDDVHKEGEFRRKQISQASKSNRTYRMIAMLSGVVLALTMLGGGIYLVMKNHPWIGTLLSASVLLGVLRTFVANPNSK